MIDWRGFGSLPDAFEVEGRGSPLPAALRVACGRFWGFAWPLASFIFRSAFAGSCQPASSAVRNNVASLMPLPLSETQTEAKSRAEVIRLRRPGIDGIPIQAGRMRCHDNRQPILS